MIKIQQWKEMIICDQYLWQQKIRINKNTWQIQFSYNHEVDSIITCKRKIIHWKE